MSKKELAKGCKVAASVCKKNPAVIVGAALAGVVVGHVLTVAAIKISEAIMYRGAGMRGMGMCGGGGMMGFCGYDDDDDFDCDCCDCEDDE